VALEIQYHGVLHFADQIEKQRVLCHFVHSLDVLLRILHVPVYSTRDFQHGHLSTGE